MGTFKKRVSNLSLFSTPFQRKWWQKEEKKPPKVHVVKRVDFLREIEGEYDYFSVDRSDPLYDSLFIRAKLDGEDIDEVLKSRLYKRIRLGRFMSTDLGFDNDRVSDFLNSVRVAKFRLSCRYNDLLRVAETPHYKTCMSNWRGIQLLRDLADQDMCIIFEPDASGKMRCRMFARLLLDGNNTVLGFYRIYGNGFDHEAIARSLRGIVTCATLSFTYKYFKRLRSYSKVHNPAVKKPVWSDHGCSIGEDGRLVFGLEDYLPTKIWEDRNGLGLS